jgi:hypothetical protein
MPKAVALLLDAADTLLRGDLEAGFVFVEVENDLMNVWRHKSVGRTQGAETFVILPLHGGITVVFLLLEERRCTQTEHYA